MMLKKIGERIPRQAWREGYDPAPIREVFAMAVVGPLKVGSEKRRRGYVTC